MEQEKQQPHDTMWGTRHVFVACPIDAATSMPRPRRSCTHISPDTGRTSHSDSAKPATQTDMRTSSGTLEKSFRHRHGNLTCFCSFPYRHGSFSSMTGLHTHTHTFLPTHVECPKVSCLPCKTTREPRLRPWKSNFWQLPP